MERPDPGPAGGPGGYGCTNLPHPGKASAPPPSQAWLLHRVGARWSTSASPSTAAPSPSSSGAGLSRLTDLPYQAPKAAPSRGPPTCCPSCPPAGRSPGWCWLYPLQCWLWWPGGWADCHQGYRRPRAGEEPLLAEFSPGRSVIFLCGAFSALGVRRWSVGPDNTSTR